LRVPTDKDGALIDNTHKELVYTVQNITGTAHKEENHMNSCRKTKKWQL